MDAGPADASPAGTGSSAAAGGHTRTLPARTGPRSRKNAAHRWTRWLHVYTSMIAFVVILFFGVTGITLNHPTWTFGDEPTRRTAAGTLPAGWNTTPVDYLAVTEYVRKTYGVSAPVSDYGTTGDQGQVSFRGPGYAADLSFSTADGSFELGVEQQGFVGVINDLHKGRDTTSSWKWLIDVSGVFLVAVAFTGLGLQLFLKKRRTRAMVVAGVGLVLTIVFVYLTL